MAFNKYNCVKKANATHPGVPMFPIFSENQNAYS